MKMKTIIILSALIIAAGIALSGGIYKVTNGIKHLKVKTNIFTGDTEIINIVDLYKSQKTERKFDASKIVGEVD
jgi:ABC-type uncharacterized transport system YnjBCD substrate-binding protein